MFILLPMKIRLGYIHFFYFRPIFVRSQRLCLSLDVLPTGFQYPESLRKLQAFNHDYQISTRSLTQCLIQYIPSFLQWYESTTINTYVSFIEIHQSFISIFIFITFLQRLQLQTPLLIAAVSVSRRLENRNL